MVFLRIRLYREPQLANLAKLHDEIYKTLHQLLKSSDESIKLKAAVEILKHTTKTVSLFFVDISWKMW